jgi:hypothetical protein
MLNSPIFYVWLVWFLAVAVFAVIRYQARLRDEQQREQRRRQRGQRPVSATRPQARRSSAPPADYRDQLIAAGVIRPAAEADSTTDPNIGLDPATAV